MELVTCNLQLRATCSGHCTALKDESSVVNADRVSAGEKDSPRCGDGIMEGGGDRGSAKSWFAVIVKSSDYEVKTCRSEGDG